MTSLRQHRRIATSLAVMVSMMVAGCTNDEREIVSLQQIVQPPAAPSMTRMTALAANGAAQMQVSFIKTGIAGTMVAETHRAGLVTWLSSDGASLQTDRGLLRATRGFGAGLMAVDLDQSRQRIFEQDLGSSQRFHSYLTGNNEIETRSYHCDIETRGARILRIDGMEITTRLMAETCINPDQRFLNLYWLRTRDNTLIQSRQWTGPFLGNMTTRLRVTR
ncbi:YjbF family lipoprotein [Phaeobacter porticola]|uniref:Group 4 capsule polysaccharide formation lipoprotein gfcB n=1 Tax=Phaeobacter porticola TaxID=1844006 RepID=A0A1L3IA61_9RHOB|nr:YjbF family lipoprotein [Phaeobacter porticola]APG48964.1 Group 4 capsule polysaccharide formation lipoprotein gfcB [Phaeobacter porticola]